jgi:hypothetical protein
MGLLVNMACRLKLNRRLCRRRKVKTLLADPQPYSPMEAEVAIPLIPTYTSYWKNIQSKFEAFCHSPILRISSARI